MLEINAILSFNQANQANKYRTVLVKPSITSKLHWCKK